MLNKIIDKLIDKEFKEHYFSVIGAEAIRTSLKLELLSHDLTVEREEEIKGLLKF